MRASFAMATLALLAVVLLGWTASGALAHAVLEAAAPEDGSRLEASPAEIVLRFSEPVALTKLQLLASEGGPAGGIGHPETDGGTIRIPVVRQLEAGSYVLSYRITSLDGHPVAGSVVFGIGTEAAASTSAADRVYWIAAVNRAINYGSLLAASGGGLFLLLVLGLDHVPGRIRLGLLFLAAVAAASLVLSVGINGLQLAGLDPGDLANPEPWQVGARTTLFRSAATGCAGLLILAIGLWPHHPKLGRVPIALGAAMALSSLVLTGHAANAPPAVLSAPGVFLHGIAAAFWVGSLWPLRVLVRRLPAEQALPSVRRFSGIASVSVALLAVSGIILSAVQIGNVDAILASPYGRTWLLKISLVLVLLALATLNRLVLTPGLSNGSRAGLSYSIAVEIAVVAGILATTSMLGQTPPPRALEGRDHSAHGHHPVGAAKSFEMKSGAYRARMQISPASRGLNRIVVHLSVGNGEPLAASDVVTVWTHARAGVEGFQRTLKPAADHFEGEVELPLAGEWTVSVEALVSDFEKASFRTTVVLPLPSGDS